MNKYIPYVRWNTETGHLTGKFKDISKGRNILAIYSFGNFLNPIKLINLNIPFLSLFLHLQLTLLLRL